MFFALFFITQTPELLLQNGHSAPVLHMSQSGDGALIATTGYDQDVKLWQASTGLLLWRIREAAGGIALSPDGSRLLTWNDQELIAWNVTERALEKRFPKRAYGGAAFAANGRAIAMVSGNHSLDLIDLATDKVIQTLRDPKLYGGGSLSPDGRYMAIAHEDGTFLWNVATGKRERELSYHVAAAMAWCPDSRRIAIVSDKNEYTRVVVAAIDGGQYADELTKPGRNIESIACNGKRVAGGAGDGSVIMWSTTDRAVTAQWQLGGGRDVYAIAFTPDGKRLVASTGDSAVRILDSVTGAAEMTLRAHSSETGDIAFFPDGRHLVATSKLERLRIWDVHAGTLDRTWKSNYHPDSLAVSPDGTLIARGYSGDVILHEATTGKQLLTMSAKDGATNQYTWKIVFTPDGKQVIGAHGDDAVAYDVATGKRVHTYKGGGEVRSVQLSKDGKKLAISGAAGAKGRLLVFDVATAKIIAKLSTLGAIDDFVLNPEWSQVAARTDSSIKVLSFPAGKLIRELKTAEYPWPLAYSPDGRHLAAGSREGKIYVWSAETGATEATFTQQHDITRSVVFSPDSLVLATGSDDTTIRLWSLQKNEEIVSLIGLDERDFFAVTPDNYYRASRNALRLVSFRVGAKVFPFEQFDLRFNRPDILLERLGHASRTVIDSHRHAYQKRLQRLGFTEAMLTGELHLPEAVITASTIEGASAKLAISAKDQKYSLVRLNVFVNDVPIFGAAGIDVRNRKLEPTLTVPLSSGRNKIQLSVLN